MDLIPTRQRMTALAAWLGIALTAAGIPLDRSLDGALVHYNGSYYGMGAETNGQMLVSTDLLNWTTPRQVIDGELPGPYELIYRNGAFYLFIRNRGLAYSADPVAAWSPVRRIGLPGEDLRLFQDPSGALFSVQRISDDEDEGEIRLQRFSAPWRTAERPDLLLDGRRGVWDALNSSVLGEPELLYYRGLYYLLYCANHPSPRTGLREVGIAVGEKVTRIENENKLPDPVLVRNAERLNRTYRTVLRSGEYTAWEGRYTTEQPSGNWTAVDYEYDGWRTDDAGFGYPLELDGVQMHTCRTKWEENELWVRREFDLEGVIPETPVLNIRNEGPVEVFLNGKRIYTTAEPNITYSNIDVSDATDGVFRPEDNVLAVHTRVSEKAPYRYLDFGLLDAGEEPVEATVYSLDNPRIVEGPNGFEKWVLYDAWWNARPATGLDRVYFFADELYIDGPTTTNSPGWHPGPMPPNFRDGFPADESVEWAERWSFFGGSWMSLDGAMRQTGVEGPAMALLKRAPAENYLFEASVRFPRSSAGEAGVVAWSDGERSLVIGINPETRRWSYQILPGNLSPKRFRLPEAFRVLEVPPGADEDALPLHRVRVMKNGGHFRIWLDEFELTRQEAVKTEIDAPGLPGLFCRGSAAEFDGVRFTVGWDEYGRRITGWGASKDGTATSGDWDLDKDLGLEQRSASRTGRAFKGALLEQYEFTVNAELEEFDEDKDQLYGIFPVFADRENYVQAMIDTEARLMVVTGKLAGRDIKPVEFPLQTSYPRRHLYDPDTPYRDIAAWVYSLRSPSVISGLDIRWLQGEYDYLEQEFFVPSDDMTVRYAELDRMDEPDLWEDGRFYEADEPKPQAQKPGILNRVTIRPEEGNYVGFGFYSSSTIVVDSRTGRYIRPYEGGELGPNEEIADDTAESETMSRPQETLVRVDVESSYFFRCVKLYDRVIIELNGRPAVTLQGAWPPAQVGLVTEGQPAFFNGIMRYEIPPGAVQE